MANGTDFEGSNAKYSPPPGVSEDQCKTLHVFKNGACIVSCWELDDTELAEVIRTRRVFSSIWSGQTLYPQFVGSESAVHAVVADFGAVWPLSKQSNPVTLCSYPVTLCSMCNQPQFESPAGITCINGHGGAAPLIGSLKNVKPQSERTITIKIPDGYLTADEFLNDCQFERG